MPSALKSQSWIIGADGVRVPFRPQPGSPKDPYLYKSAKAAFDGRTQRCQARFKHWHHPLCHGRPSKVRAEIEQRVEPGFSKGGLRLAPNPPY